MVKYHRENPIPLAQSQTNSAQKFIPNPKQYIHLPNPNQPNHQQHNHPPIHPKLSNHHPSVHHQQHHHPNPPSTTQPPPIDTPPQHRPNLPYLPPYQTHVLHQPMRPTEAWFKGREKEKKGVRERYKGKRICLVTASTASARSTNLGTTPIHHHDTNPICHIKPWAPPNFEAHGGLIQGKIERPTLPKPHQTMRPTSNWSHQTQDFFIK